MNRDDELPPPRVGLELLAERRDVDIHGARHRRRVVAPHLVKQLVAREHSAAVLDQMAQELEFEPGQLDRPAVARDLRPARVDLHAAERVALRGRADQVGGPPRQQAGWEHVDSDSRNASRVQTETRAALGRQGETALKDKSSDACAIGRVMVSMQAIGDQLRSEESALQQKVLAILSLEQRIKYDAFRAGQQGERSADWTQWQYHGRPPGCCRSWRHT